MRVKSLSLSNFKGFESSIECSGSNLLLGFNRSGKTAHVQALEFAITGATNLGATLEATSQLAGPNGCSVDVELDDGFQWTRSIDRHPRTKALSMTVRIAGEDGLTKADANKRILDHVGDFPAMLNVNRFLGLSPDKRRDFIVDLCSASGSTLAPEDIANKILLAYWSEKSGRTIGAGESLDQVLDRLPTPEGKTLNGMLMPAIRRQLTGTLPECIGNALEETKKIANNSKRVASDSEGAARALTLRRNELAVPADVLAVLESDRQAARVRWDELLELHGRVHGSLVSKDLAQVRIDALTKREDKIRRQLDDRQSADKLDELQRELTTAETKLGDSESRLASGVTLTAEGLEEIRFQLESAVKDVVAMEGRRDMHKRDLAADRVALVEDEARQCLNRLLRGAEAALTDLGLLLHTCEPFSALARAIGIHCGRSKQDELQGKIDADENAITSSEALVEEMIARRSVGEDELECAEAAWEKNIETRQGKLQADAAIEHCSIEIRRIRDRAEEWRGELSDVQHERLETEKGLESHVQAVAGYTLDSITEHIRSAKAEVNRLDGLLDVKRDDISLAGEIEKTIGTAEANKVLHEVSAAMADAIRDLREELMADMLAPLVDHLNCFLGSASPWDRAYCELSSDRGKAVFELGIVESTGAKVSLPAMSGAQACLFVAGFSSALIKLAKVPLRLLILEVDALDAGMLGRLMVGLSNATDGVQAFVLMHTLPSKFPLDDAWRVHRLDADGEAAHEVGVGDKTMDDHPHDEV